MPAAATSAALAASSTPAAAAPSEPADSSAYAIVAEAPSPIFLTPMKGGGIAQISGLLFQLGEGSLTQEPNFARGIKKSDVGRAQGGEWPKSAWFEASDDEGKPKLYKWFEALGGRWEVQQILRDGEKLMALGAVGENVVAAIAMPANDIRIALVGGKGGVLPAPAAIKKEAPAAAEGEEPAAPSEEPDTSCKVKMSPSAPFFLAGTASGYAFAAGMECKDSGDPGAALVERWEPKKTRGTIEPLPAPASGTVALGGVLAVSETEGYVWGGAGGAAYLARWDGKAWALDKVPFQKTIKAMAAVDDGTVFAAAEDGYYTKNSNKAGGAWEKVALPKKIDGFEPTGVYARTASDVWVSGKAGDKHYLLRSAKVEKTAVMPATKAVEDTLKSNFRFMATPLCAKPYAHLFSVGPSATPVPKEFPAVKKAFEGKKFDGAKLVLEDDGANLFVGAKAASAEQAEAIVAAFMEGNPKMKARVFCHDPQVKKEVDWPSP